MLDDADAADDTADANGITDLQLDCNDTATLTDSATAIANKDRLHYSTD